MKGKNEWLPNCGLKSFTEKGVRCDGRGRRPSEEESLSLAQPLIVRRCEKIVMNQILHSLGHRYTGFTTSSSRHWLEQNMRNIIMAMAMILVICKMSQESFGSFLSGSKAKKRDQNSPEVAQIYMESGISSGMLSLHKIVWKHEIVRKLTHISFIYYTTVTTIVTYNTRSLLMPCVTCECVGSVLSK